MSLLEELKRRNVFKVATAYVVSAWLLIQVADVILENLGTPVWVMQTLLGLLAVGFPIAVTLAWIFELTSEGMKREHDIVPGESITNVTGRKLDFAIIGLLAVATLYFIWESRFQSSPAQRAAETTIASDNANDSASALAISDDTSLAVLPFVNLSSDPEQEFFADGISEELLNVLAQFPGLRVVARTSSFQFKGDNRDIREIAQLLQANHILEGSVRKAGNQVRVTAQLINASTGYHLWSQTYDRDLDDIFAIQDDISASIGTAMEKELGLGASPLEVLPHVYKTASTEAYSAFLEARSLNNLRGLDNVSKAARLLEQSILLDPAYAPAHAQLAISYLILETNSSGGFNIAEIGPPEELTEKARFQIDRAEQLDPNLAELWAAKGLLALSTENFQQALDFTARALVLNPAYIDALNWRRIAANKAAEFEIEEEAHQRMIKTDPYSVIARIAQAQRLALSDPVRAHAIADSIVKQNPAEGYLSKNIIALRNENETEAMRWILLAHQANPSDINVKNVAASYLSVVGGYEEALAISGGDRIGALWSASRYAEVAADFEKLLAMFPDNSELTVSAGDAYYMAGDFSTALAYYDTAAAKLNGKLLVNVLQLRSSNGWYIHVLRDAGRNAEAATILEKTQKYYSEIEALFSSRPEFLPDYHAKAMLHILTGNNDAALDALESAWDFSVFRLDNPMYEALHSNERFRSLRLREAERNRVLRAEGLELICNNNPIPDTWQPLESTCEGLTTEG